jgi:hypothetical protein
LEYFRTDSGMFQFSLKKVAVGLTAALSRGGPDLKSRA